MEQLKLAASKEQLEQVGITWREEFQWLTFEEVNDYENGYLQVICAKDLDFRLVTENWNALESWDIPKYLTKKCSYHKQRFVITDDMMTYLGFDCAKSNDNYATYINNGSRHWNKDYNSDFAESRGRVVIHINRDYGKTGTFAQIEQDGGTRKVFHGSIASYEALVMTLASIR
jgi:hypothetical protein